MCWSPGVMTLQWLCPCYNLYRWRGQFWFRQWQSDSDTGGQTQDGGVELQKLPCCPASQAPAQGSKNLCLLVWRGRGRGRAGPGCGPRAGLPAVSGQSAPRWGGGAGLGSVRRPQPHATDPGSLNTAQDAAPPPPEQSNTPTHAPSIKVCRPQETICKTWATAAPSSRWQVGK